MSHIIRFAMQIAQLIVFPNLPTCHTCTNIIHILTHQANTDFLH
jgi:hypothetical protein